MRGGRFVTSYQLGYSLSSDVETSLYPNGVVLTGCSYTHFGLQPLPRYQATSIRPVV